MIVHFLHESYCCQMSSSLLITFPIILKSPIKSCFTKTWYNTTAVSRSTPIYTYPSLIISLASTGKPSSSNYATSKKYGFSSLANLRIEAMASASSETQNKLWIAFCTTRQRAKSVPTFCRSTSLPYCMSRESLISDATCWE